MAWVKLDDGFVENRKVENLSDRAFRLYITALCYCGRNLTDGALTSRAVKLTAAHSGATKRHIAELADMGLWLRASDGYVVNDYLAYNPSRDQVEEYRDYKRRAKDLFRDSALRRAIKERDGNRCRYCGIKVNWQDRKGPSGATYDHVDPKGGNSLEEIVVACRSCNGIKGGRTPAQAGMPLLPAPYLVQNLGQDLDQNLEDVDTRPRPDVKQNLSFNGRDFKTPDLRAMP